MHINNSFSTKFPREFIRKYRLFSNNGTTGSTGCTYWGGGNIDAKAKIEQKRVKNKGKNEELGMIKI